MEIRMRLSLVASLTLLAAAGALAAPLSKQAALKIMHERHEGMETVGKTNKVLRREVTADSPSIPELRSAAGTMLVPEGHWPGTRQDWRQARNLARPEGLLRQASRFSGRREGIERRRRKRRFECNQSALR
jgi:hypothetical protein